MKRFRQLTNSDVDSHEFNLAFNNTRCTGSFIRLQNSLHGCHLLIAAYDETMKDVQAALSILCTRKRNNIIDSIWSAWCIIFQTVPAEYRLTTEFCTQVTLAVSMIRLRAKCPFNVDSLARSLMRNYSKQSARKKVIHPHYGLFSMIRSWSHRPQITEYHGHTYIYSQNQSVYAIISTGHLIPAVGPLSGFLIQYKVLDAKSFVNTTLDAASCF